jgi:hypothetical protein
VSIARRTLVKHAYASTHRYDPSIAWLGELVRDGAIGTVREIEYTCRLALPPLSLWGWWDMLVAGGGVLINWFTHVLGMVATITGGDLLRVMGQARPGRPQAPVVPDIHDFRVPPPPARARDPSPCRGAARLSGRCVVHPASGVPWPRGRGAARRTTRQGLAPARPGPSVEMRTNTQLRQSAKTTNVSTAVIFMSFPHKRCGGTPGSSEGRPKRRTRPECQA